MTTMNTGAASLSDEQIEALKAAALAATPQNIDSAQRVERYEDGSHILCPACGGEGYVELNADFCNYDGEALGVQFYGIGNAHVLAEAYFRAAKPATVLALIERLERAEATPTSQSDAAPSADDAWESYLAEQKLIIGMPGLHARPSFIAGYRAAIAAGGAQEAVMTLPQPVIDALRFYAHGHHFNIDNDHHQFDTVSGEPQNWLMSHREDDCSMIEDGSIAKAVLLGGLPGFEEPTEPLEGEVYAALLPRVAAAAWQPIETAPKTGRTLLLGYPNVLGKWRTVRGQWMSEAYIAESWEEPDDAEPGWYETAVEAENPPNCWPIEPTHWMPLPAAPAASNGEQ
jgi:hypothetical protein